MSVVDQVFKAAYEENPVLGVLLGILFDGGRVITVGPVAEDLFNLVPDTLYFEKREMDPVLHFADFSAKDCIFVENCSVDQLWQLSQITGAQIAHISKRPTDDSLVDYEINDAQLRSALLSLKGKYEQVRSFKGQIFVEGSRLNKALFLDRDGVIIDDTGYVREASDVRILGQVSENLRLAREKGYLLFVISNQSGIGRGLMDWDQYEKVTAQMQSLLCQEGLYFDRILRAPFYQNSHLASGLVRKSLRKPRPGMIHKVVSEFRVDLQKSILVGDSATDLMAGALAGIGQLCLVNSGKSTDEFEKWTRWPLISRYSQSSRVKRIKNLSEVL